MVLIDSVELFDHVYISRRNRQNDRFRVYTVYTKIIFTMIYRPLSIGHEALVDAASKERIFPQ